VHTIGVFTQALPSAALKPNDGEAISSDDKFVGGATQKVTSISFVSLPRTTFTFAVSPFWNLDRADM
jgi:hypothetical protein